MRVLRACAYEEFGLPNSSQSASAEAEIPLFKGALYYCFAIVPSFAMAWDAFFKKKSVPKVNDYRNIILEKVCSVELLSNSTLGTFFDGLKPPIRKYRRFFAIIKLLKILFPAAAHSP